MYSEKSNFAFFLCHSNANHSICMALETLMDRERDYSWDWANRSEYVPSDTEISSFVRLDIRVVLLDKASTVKSSSSASVGVI